MKFYELLTIFESSYYQIHHHSINVLYPGKFMNVFGILQLLVNTFLKIR